MFVQSTVPLRGANPGIGANNAHFSAALAHGDAAGMAACYTPDARLLPPGHPAIRGREEIQAFWSAGIASGLRAVTLETLELEVSGDRALEIGRATIRIALDGSATIDAGKYVVVHERHDGAWRRAIDIFNSDGGDDA